MANLLTQIAGIAAILSGTQTPRQTAELEMYEFIEGDDDCASILKKYGAGRETLSQLYWNLLTVGAGRWVGKHYVPVSALCFPLTLDYLLSSQAGTSEMDRADHVAKMIALGGFDRRP